MSLKKSAEEDFGIVKTIFKEFKSDDCPRMAAAMAYYTIFALGPIIILILLIAGVFVDPQQIRGTIQDQMQSILGQQGAQQVSTMIANARKPGVGGPFTIILSIGALLFSATGAFFQLQKALNNAWGVKPDPEQSGIKNFLMKRLASLVMILFIALLLLAALILSTLLNAFGGFLGSILPSGITQYFLIIADWIVTLGIVMLMFAATFKVLPNAEIVWHDVWLGSFVTAILFAVGKFLIGLYLGHSNPGSTFGAAGSLAILLVWIYLSAMIFFLGAEFTQVWMRHEGKQITPSKGAVKFKD